MNCCLCFSFLALRPTKESGKGGDLTIKTYPQLNHSLLGLDILQTRFSQTLCISPSFQVLHFKTMMAVFHMLKNYLMLELC